MSAQGVLHVHSAPPALAPHIEWAVAGILGVPVDLPWTGQPASPGSLRAELTWEGRPGSAGAITSALAGWNRLRFEVTEAASAGCDGVRHSYTPTLGLFTAVTSGNGDILVPEGRLRTVVATAGTDSDLRRELDRLLGRAWDEELDVFRCGADGAPVRWLHATG
ncbi:MAG TPA: DUF3145 domain-containing protein [Streptosporangiaceae bacterium]|nr:DUF3145 domain-containing protein [Streptosporangiaceae bacterium]